ncbi:MAG: glyoxalase [Terriglobia bacterium]|nr:MAG: glyoxalase [Terriglobia bacterium]
MFNIAHFSINADDVTRARKFYEGVFGWKCQPWGPPEFYMLTTKTGETPGILGSLQRRREIVKGKPMFGCECTVAVESIDETIAAVQKSGGRVVMPKSVISGVGTLIFFEDTEGNILGAMHYDSNAE